MRGLRKEDIVLESFFRTFRRLEPYEAFLEEPLLLLLEVGDPQSSLSRFIIMGDAIVELGEET